VVIADRRFGTDARWDRAIALAPLIEESPALWGPMDPPSPSPAKKVARRQARVRVETAPAAFAPPVVTTARVQVKVLRGGRSSQMLVYVDGKPALRAPNEVELSPGPHVLEIRPKGKAAIRKNVGVRAGETIEVVLDAGDDVD
jgi:hypothetical protein